MQQSTKLRVLEFVVAGLVLDTVENIASIKLSTGSKITWEVFLVAFLVVVPFSVLTEVVIDHPLFWSRCGAFFRRLWPKRS